MLVMILLIAVSFQVGRLYERKEQDREAAETEPHSSTNSAALNEGQRQESGEEDDDEPTDRETYDDTAAWVRNTRAAMTETYHNAPEEIVSEHTGDTESEADSLTTLTTECAAGGPPSQLHQTTRNLDVVSIDESLSTEPNFTPGSSTSGMPSFEPLTLPTLQTEDGGDSTTTASSFDLFLFADEDARRAARDA